LQTKSSGLKSLTFVDCNINGISKLIDAAGMNSLEQLIIIYNRDLEEDEGSYDRDECPIYLELLKANLSKYPNLMYFEFSTYNDIAYPGFT
jgi:hypothetical protein